VAHAYAKQKFFEALYCLIGNKSLRTRLTYAAEALMTLQPHDLPEKMRDDFKQFLRDLTSTSLSIHTITNRGTSPREKQRDSLKKFWKCTRSCSADCYSRAPYIDAL
jgi:hypothetical protein